MYIEREKYIYLYPIFNYFIDRNKNSTSQCGFFVYICICMSVAVVYECWSSFTCFFFIIMPFVLVVLRVYFAVLVYPVYPQIRSFTVCVFSFNLFAIWLFFRPFWFICYTIEPIIRITTVSKGWIHQKISSFSLVLYSNRNSLRINLFL